MIQHFGKWHILVDQSGLEYCKLPSLWPQNTADNSAPQYWSCGEIPHHQLQTSVELLFLGSTGSFVLV